MQRFGCIHQRHHLFEHMVCDGIDLHIRLRQSKDGCRVCCQRTCMNQFGLDSFNFKGMVQIRSYTPSPNNCYLHILQIFNLKSSILNLQS